MRSRCRGGKLSAVVSPTVSREERERLRRLIDTEARKRLASTLARTGYRADECYSCGAPTSTPRLDCESCRAGLRRPMKPREGVRPKRLARADARARPGSP
jgi:hypothetical protein